MQITPDLPADISTPASLVPGTPFNSTLELTSPETASDTDFFQVTLEAEQVYTVAYSLDQGILAGAALTLFDATGQAVFSLGEDGLIPFTVTEGGDYYVSFSAWVGLELPQTAPIGYSLTVVDLGPDDVGSTAETAGTLELEAPVQSDLIYLGDADWYAVSLEAGTTVTLLTLEDSATPNGDALSISLVNADGEVLTSASGEGPTTPAVEIVQSGVYYAVVESPFEGFWEFVTFSPQQTVSLLLVEGTVDPLDLEGTDVGDTLEGSDWGDTLNGLGGDDLLLGYGSPDILIGGAGNDRLLGGDGNDQLFGDEGDDIFAGGPGDDYILADYGNDNVGGGTGDDVILGGDGQDTIGAGQGNDDARGGEGDDIVNGGAGDDTLSGDDGHDTIGAGFNSDNVDGGAGDDSIGGGTGQDTLHGGLGNDAIGAGEGNDTVFGDAGNDFLAGGGRNDLIDGGLGNDTINGGDGDDTMTGGDGADVFVWNFFKDGDADVITDFEDGVDSFLIRIVNPETGEANISNGGNGLQGYVAALNITDTANGALIDYQGHTVLIEGVAAADLTTDDFAFV